MAITVASRIAEQASFSATISKATTATFDPAAGEVHYAAFVTIGAPGGVITLTGNGLTWVPVLQLARSDNAARMLTIFRSAGDGTSGALTLTYPGAATFSRWIVHVCSVTGADTGGSSGSAATVQAVSSNTLNTDAPSLAITMTSGNALLGYFATYPSNRTFTPGDGYTQIDQTNQGTNETLFSEYRTSDDTNIDASFTTAINLNGIGIEVKLAPTGPTITVQPSADVVLINGDPTRASAAYACTATGTGTVDIVAEIESGAGTGVYGTLANGSGATWTGLTATGSGSASASLGGTFTAKTLTGRRIRFKADDDNGTTYSDAVLLTVYTGPVLSKASGTTNASGVDTLTITSDYPNGVGEFTVTTATSRGITKTVSQVFA